MEPKSTNTGYAHISKLNTGRYLLDIPQWVRDEQGITQQKKSSKSLIKLWKWRNKKFGHDFGEEMPGVTVEGNLEIIRPVPKGRNLSDEALWEQAIKYQEALEEQIEDTWYPITITSGKPIAIAFMSDMHIGSPHVNYKALLADTKLIADTEGMYMIVLGDERDNFVGNNLNHARFNNRIPVTDEQLMYLGWKRIVEDDMLAYVTGNHDLWSWKRAGVDLANMMLPEVVLYDQYEVRIALSIGNSHTWQLKLRHRWPGRNIYNWTNGIERSWQFQEFDIGVGGDYHDATLCREFVRGGQIRYAILLGTYKNLDDPFHKQINKVQCPHVGCGSVIFYPDGEMQWFRSVEKAADHLSDLRRKL